MSKVASKRSGSAAIKAGEVSSNALGGEDMSCNLHAAIFEGPRAVRDGMLARVKGLHSHRRCKREWHGSQRILGCLGNPQTATGLNAQAFPS